MEREKGFETGFTKGGHSRALAANSAGFANSDPDKARRYATSCTLALGNWWETGCGPQPLALRAESRALRAAAAPADRDGKC
jgi:hypothetical protein